MIKFGKNLGYLIIPLCFALSSCYDLPDSNEGGWSDCEYNRDQEWAQLCNGKAQLFMLTNYGISGERPNWINNKNIFNLEKEMQIAHYGTHGRNTLQLCHRFSWVNIRCTLDAAFQLAAKYDYEYQAYDVQHYSMVEKFVNDKLATPDPEAIVNFGCWIPPYTKDNFIDNKPWFENHYTKRFATEYLTPALHAGIKKLQDLVKEKLNEGGLNFWKESYEPSQIAENKKHMQDILRYANSMPANLRYGPGGTNAKIGKCFDPMGNNQGGLTNNEIDLLTTYRSYVDVKYKAAGTFDSSQNLTASNCPQFPNSQSPIRYAKYIRSTTGYFEYYSSADENWWWFIGSNMN